MRKRSLFYCIILYSPYVYCADNPVNKINPDGRSEWPVNRTYNRNGRRHENNWHASRPRRGLHQGVDVNHTGGGNTDQGAPIVATHNGTVVRVEQSPAAAQSPMLQIPITEIKIPEIKPIQN